jgi:hypothetical protein
MKEATTQSIRIDKEVAQDVKAYGAKQGASIKALVEAAVKYIMKRKFKLNLEDNEFYENQQR